MIAGFPLGGLTWHYLQYLQGFRRLGHDVYYLEDFGQWPYNPVERGLAKDCDYNVAFLAQVMTRIGLADKWAYRFPWHSQWFGLSESRRRSVVESADLLVNVSGSLERPDLYKDAGRLVYIDTDPVFTQVRLARGQEDFCQRVDAHDVHFSFGETLAGDVPATDHIWRPTRQPVVLSEWTSHSEHRGVFTTVMNWTSYKSINYEGRVFGQKDVEFRKYIGLPSMVAPSILEVAIAEGKTRRTPHALLAHNGWRLVDPVDACPDLDSYRSYIESSAGEWSVAKNAYVIGRAGWFSERSACYLAAGRPVILQDTGFKEILPVGEGLLSFSTIEEAASGIREVEGDFRRHSKAARAIAEEYFDSDAVLSKLLDVAGAG